MQTRDELGQYLNEHGLLGEGVEVGVFRGIFAEIILKVWKGRTLWGVDCWKVTPYYAQIPNDALSKDEGWSKTYGECKQRFVPFGERSKLIRAESLDAAKQFADSSLDFVYIDAEHSYEAVSQDIAAWWPKLKPGGLFSGHDYYDGVYRHRQYGVRKAVEEFAAANKIPKILLTRDRLRTWYFHKVAE